MSKSLAPVVSVSPATVEFDFDSYSSQLDEYIADYNIVVTEDTVADAKKAATELNKLDESIRVGFKKHVDELKAPADKLSKYSRELREKCQVGRKRILEQVAEFDQKQLDKAKVLLEEFKLELYEAHGVRDEFQTVSVEPLVGLSALTSTGKLSKSARDKLEGMVKDKSALQSKTDMRLAELKAYCYEAGLAAPLSRDHVESFIFADDATYKSNLDRIIEREKEREQIAKDKYAPQPDPQPEPQPEAVADDSKHVDVGEEAMAELPEPELEGDTKVVRLSAYYEFQLSSDIPESSVRASLMTRLIQLGVKPNRIDIL